MNGGVQQEVGLYDLGLILWRHRVLVASTTATATVVAAVVSLAMTPIYRAQTLIAPVTEQKASLGALTSQLGGLAELSGISLSGSGDKATAIATLKSRTLTEAFIRERNLLPVLFEKDWDSDGRRWKTSDPEDAPTLWDGCLAFDGSIRQVQEERKTGLVILTVDWRDPQQAADWANELVRRANQKLQRDAIEEGHRAISFLEQQLARAGAIEVRQALYSLIEAETKKVAVAHAREEFAFKVIDAAVPPRKKFKPQRKLITLMGFALGLIGSSLVAVVLSAGAARRQAA